MPQLRRNARPLLKTIHGKPHASADDHEEGKKQTGQDEATREEDIFADPISSDEETGVQAAPPNHTSRASTSSKPEKRTNASQISDNMLRKSTKGKKIPVPRQGSFSKGRMDKARIDGLNKANKTSEKENVQVASANSAEEKDAIFGGMEYRGAKRQKTGNKSLMYSKNIHATPAAYGKKTFSKTKPSTYSAAWKKQLVGVEDDNIDNHNPPSITLGKDFTVTSQSNKSISSPQSSARASPERLNCLSSVAVCEKPTDSAHVDSGASTPLSSVPASVILEDLERDVEAPPSFDVDSTCALCEVPVDPDFSREFWRYKIRTVRNSTLFCKEHKRRTAQAEYENSGFPEINWDDLSGRIANLRSEIEGLLRNEGEESEYRKRWKENLAGGKAAALQPRREKNRAQQLENEALHDEMSVSTGYYGPRGRKLMMEAITSEMSDVIREVAATDPVVGRSGFAVFLQAVLVPELTVLLVMEDLDIGAAKAREVIEESGEIGALLHEEVGDTVERDSDEELSDEGYDE